MVRIDKATRDDWSEPKEVSMNHGPATKMPDSNDESVWIADMLKRKKKQTDREIADFKAEKERDYIAFEQRLRAGDREIGGQGAIRPSLDARDIDKRREEPPDYGEQQESDMANEEFSRAPEKEPATPSNPDSFTPPIVHEREVEFQGLFTPSYLPLLDSSPDNLRRASSKTPLTISIKPNQLTTLARGSTLTLSSSATLPTSIISSSSSPPNARRISVSLPKEGSLNIRRSTSRSDTSIASLRSSLRDPKQPRSPKHVLFSIDNVVVSPSTSPVAQRSSSAPQAQTQRVDNISKGLDKIIIGKSKESYKVEGEWDDRVYSTNPQTTVAKPVSSKGKELAGGLSFQAFDAMNATSLVGGDDFERVGYDDDLFSFDEDMDLGAPGHTEKKNDDIESDDEDSVDKEVTTSSSPHAGSLPIEIKWPARPDPRN